MLIAVPIGVSGGTFLGAVTAKINLRTLAETLQRFKPGESGQVYAAEKGRHAHRHLA